MTKVFEPRQDAVDAIPGFSVGNTAGSLASEKGNHVSNKWDENNNKPTLPAIRRAFKCRSGYFEMHPKQYKFHALSNDVARK